VLLLPLPLLLLLLLSASPLLLRHLQGPFLRLLRPAQG
jgi:hypothetical protein